MKKAVKVIGWVLGFAVLVVLAGMVYVKFALPNVGAAPELKVEPTPARIERGAYLANHVVVCMDCHSTRNYELFSAPLVAGTLGKGGEVFDQRAGFPGIFTSKNITPFGIGSWTDGEIYRAITTGVSRDGHAFFPVMPYPYYGQMNEEDVKSIIAYLRTLPAIDNKPADSQAYFPFNFILNTIPKAANPLPMPAATDEVGRGKYLITIAGCVECHTPFKNGQLVLENAYAGGREFALPTGTVYTPNLTPDQETGLGRMSKEAFIARFKVYADSSYQPQKIGPGEFQTIMPWMMYAGMKEEDLGAIYTYLKTLEPVKNLIPQKFVPAGSPVASR